MPYPDIKLTKTMRRAFMIFLITAFFVISPLVVLYAAGYTFNTKTLQVERTGVISIDVLPNNVIAQLNGIDFYEDEQIIDQITNIQGRSKFWLPTRTPGDYNLVLHKPGYKNWEKNITVESNKTTYVRDITLFQDNSPIPIQLPGDAKNVIVSPDGTYVLLVEQHDDIVEVQRINTVTKDTDILLRYSAEKKLRDISWSPYHKHTLLLHLSDQEQDDIYLVDVSRPTTLTNQTFSSTSSTQNIVWQWSPDTNPMIYISHQKEIYPLAFQQVGEKRITPSAVWYIDDQETLWGFDTNTNKLTREDLPFRNEFVYESPHPITKIIDINSRRIIAQTPNGIVILLRNDNDGLVARQKTIEATSYQYNAQTGSIFAWSSFELWEMFPDGSVNLLDRTTQTLQQVLPLTEYGDILLTTPSQLTAFHPGYFVHTPLTQAQLEHSQIGVNTETQVILFTGKIHDTERLYMLEY